MSTNTMSTPGTDMAETYRIPVGTKISGDQLLKKTLIIDLDPELYDSWCNIGTFLNLTAHSQIVAFLINFYQENRTARENWEKCRAGLHHLTQHSPQFGELSKKTQKNHLQNQLHLFDKCEGDKNHTVSKLIVKTKQNPVTSMSCMEEDSDNSTHQDVSFDVCPNIDSDSGDETFDSSSFPELLTTDGVKNEINDNALDNYAARRLEPNPGNFIFFPVNGELGPMPKIQNCTETWVEGQQKLKQVKVVYPPKGDAKVLPRLYKILGLLKKSDTICAPSLEAADVKTEVNNFDDIPIQGQSNDPQKMIYILNKNVVAPEPKEPLLGQAANNISDTDCTQSPRMLLPGTLVRTFIKEEGKVAASPILQATNSMDSNKIAQGQNLMTLMWLPKKIDTVPLPEVQSVRQVSDNQVSDTDITNKLIHQKNLANEIGQLKDLCVSGAKEDNNTNTFDPPRKNQRYPQSSIKTTYVCPICDKSYASAVGYKNHKDQHVGDLTCCSICNKKYSSVILMRRHQMTMHQGLKPFKCDLCDKQFTHNCKLKQHMLFHGDATPYTCFCGKAFKTSQHLKCHSKAVHSSRDHVCEVCGKAFKLLSSLEGHRKHVHEGLQRRRHACEFCGTSFADRRSMKLHRLRHTGEPRLGKGFLQKRVICKACGKSFLLSNIKKHMRTHTGEKPYFCVICCKSFSTQKHKRIHELCKV